MAVFNRRLGLEQEFFLVDREGVLSNQSDAVLQRCQEIAQANGVFPQCFTPEFAKSMVEVKTTPAHNLTDLIEQYICVLAIALQAAQDLNLRLYPLSTYPLHNMALMRDKLNYHVQARTIGADAFEKAARCTGTHLHLELPPGTVDRRVAVSYTSTPEARAELLNLHNLATALDAALIALSRSCPFYEGQISGLAMRTVHYRGSEHYGWEGVYNHIQAVGGLLPYSETIEDLVVQYFHRYYTWLEAMDRAEVERQLFWQSGGELLTAGWNPVRLNKLGTLELRAMDSNYPSVIVALITLVVNAANRVRQEHLTVIPNANLKKFKLQETQLHVPEFGYLNGELLYAAVTEGTTNPIVKEYIDSVLAFAMGEDTSSNTLTQFRAVLDGYYTTEARLLEEFAPVTDHISYEEGLRLVQHCCDQLEIQVKQIQENQRQEKLASQQPARQL